MNSSKNQSHSYSPLRVCRDYHARAAGSAESAVRSVLLDLEASVSRLNKRAGLAKEYEARFGPLTLNGANSDAWLQDPWPWDADFDTDE